MRKSVKPFSTRIARNTKPFFLGEQKNRALLVEFSPLARSKQVLYCDAFASSPATGLNGLYVFPVSCSGAVTDTPVQLHAEEIPSGVDGMVRDCAGNVYVVAGGVVHVLERDTAEILASGLFFRELMPMFDFEWA